MSKQRKRIYLVTAVFLLLLAGAVVYSATVEGNKTPGGVFVCL